MLHLYYNSTPLHQDRRLFCTFVDYSKAFDSINRPMLWKKLISYDVSGKVLNVIPNMYKSIKSCVMEMKLDEMRVEVGVKENSKQKLARSTIHGLVILNTWEMKNWQ